MATDNNNDLTSFVKEADSKSKFIRFVDGESIEGVYQGAHMVDDKFNQDEKTVEYTIGIDGTAKTFNSRSVKLARQLQTISKGTKIAITRSGTGMKTDWAVIVNE